jgi:SAM-dependent methyltransferase
MDRPDLDRDLHRRALRSLARLHRLSGTARALWRELEPFARAHRGRPLRVLDLATGGGDLPRALAERASRAGVPIAIDGCDVSPTAVREALRQRPAPRGATLGFFELDLLREELPQDYDVLMCTLFLHHLADADARRLLARMAAAARVGVIVQDLVRTATGMWLARVATSVLTRDPVTCIDGPLSVAAAFTIDEARELVSGAGLRGAVVRPIFPSRWMLTWERALESTVPPLRVAQGSRGG